MSHGRSGWGELEALEPRLLLSSVVLYEGFEGAFPNQWVLGTEGGTTGVLWGDSQSKASAGGWSGFCADNGNDLRNTYDNDLHTYMERWGLSLAGYAGARLTFDYWLNTEAGWDPFTVLIQDQVGVWHEVFRDSGDDSDLGWQHGAVNLGGFAGQTGLTLRFRFDSDGSIVPAAPSGVWVDEVRVEAFAQGWKAADVGTVQVAGNQVLTDTAGMVSGEGAGIGGEVDGFHFVYRPFIGDGQIVARVTGLAMDPANPAARAGVMIRQSLQADAVNAMTALTLGGSAVFQRRLTAGARTDASTRTDVAAPYWVRLVRSGALFSSYISADGLEWVPVGSERIGMGQTVYAGFAVTGQMVNTPCVAAFDNLSVTSDWQALDIGDVAAAGSASLTGGTWTIRACGRDIWDYADEFQYACQTLTGDGEIVSRVVSVDNTDPWAKAGVMLRGSLEADSPHAGTFVTPGFGASFQRRLYEGGASYHTTASSPAVPYWVRLVRKGDTFISYARASAGEEWQELGRETIYLPATLYAGLAVTSHNSRMTCQAVLDNVTVRQGLMPDLRPAAFSGPAEAQQGQSVGRALRLTVANDDAADVPAYSVGVYLSTDAEITASDWLLVEGRQVFGPLAGGTQDQVLFDWDVAIPEEVLPGSYWLGVLVDDLGQVAESDEADNWRSIPIEIVVPPRPDLEIAYFAAPPKAAPGENITFGLSARFSNLGNADSPPCLVGVYLSADPVITSDDILLTGGEEAVGSIPAMSSLLDDFPSIFASMSVPETVTPGSYYIGVLIDNRGAVFESDETNNYKSQPISIVLKPDLDVSIYDTWIEVLSQGQKVGPNAHFYVRNTGPVASGAFSLGLYLSTDPYITASDRLLTNGRQTVASIPAGGAVQVDVNPLATVPADLPPGYYYLGVMVDDLNAVDEKNEHNNDDALYVWLAGPDVEFASFTCERGAAGPGQSLDGMVKLKVRNSGVSSTGPFSVRLYLSADATVTAGDTPLTAPISVASLAPGETRDVTVPSSIAIPAGTAPGLRHIGALLDVNDDVAENDETNNAVSLPITITTDTWTIMGYFVGDCNLEHWANGCLAQMEQVNTAGAPVNLYVLLDRHPNGEPKPTDPNVKIPSSGSAWADTRWGEVAYDGVTGTYSTNLQIFDPGSPELNTGDPNVLVNYVRAVMQAAPAQHYLLWFFDHGSMGGFGQDDASGGDGLSLPDLQGAFDDLPFVDVVFFDACLMQDVEVATELIGEAAYLVASQTSRHGGSLGSNVRMEKALQWLVQNPQAVPLLLARRLVLEDLESVGAGGISVVDLARMPQLNDALDAFAALALSTATAADWERLKADVVGMPSFAWDTYRDLFTYVDNVAKDAQLPAAIRNAAAAVRDLVDPLRWQVIADQRGAGRGITITLADSGSKIRADYTGSYFTFLDTTDPDGTRWAEFVRKIPSSLPVFQLLLVNLVADLIGNDESSAEPLGPAGARCWVKSNINGMYDEDYLSFTAQAGDVLALELYGWRGAELRPVLTVHGPGGFEQQVIAGPDGVAVLPTPLPLPADGVYYVVISSVGVLPTPLPEPSGAYTLAAMYGPPAAVHPDLASLATTTLDFGTVGAAGWTSRSVRLENRGGTDLRITGLAFEDPGSPFLAPFDAAVPLPIVIPPGVSYDLSVGVQPGLVGLMADTLHVLTNDPDTPDLAIELLVRGADDWQRLDIGPAGAAGSAYRLNETWTIEGAGNGAYGTSDDLYLVYRPLASSGVLTARVAWLGAADEDAQTGLMVRQSLDPGAPFAGIFVTPARTQVLSRGVAGGGSGGFDWSIAGEPSWPAWLRLVRTVVGSGPTAVDRIEVLTSPDGQGWTSTTIDLPHAETAFAGMVVASAEGNELTTSLFQHVSLQQAPVVVPGGPYWGYEGDAILLNASGTYDPDPGDAIGRYEWDFGDGSPIYVETLRSAPDGAFDGRTTHVFRDNGLYTVNVRAYDPWGLMGTAHAYVTLDNRAPAVSARSNLGACWGQPLAIQVATFTDAGAADTHTARVNWGDTAHVDVGAVVESGGSGTVTADHVYTAPGEYIVTVTVRDDEGAEGQDTFLIAVTGELDFGDAPESYGTLLEDGGPRHRIAGPYFGQLGQPAPAGLPDADADGQPDPWALGDDGDAQGDDEGYNWLDRPPVTSAEFLLRPAVRGGGGFVSAWVDFDGSGHFDPDELVYSDWLDEGDHEIPIRTPADAQVGTTFARFRISTTPDLGPLGFAEDGEVEDYRVWIHQADWGDAPPPYATDSDQDGACHISLDALLGHLVDVEPEARVDPDALGDDLDATGDEDGVVFLTPLVPGSMATVKVIATGAGQGSSFEALAIGWVDFDGNGSWEGYEQVVSESFTFPSLMIETHEREVTFQVPPTARPGRTFARFRLFNAYWPDIGPTGYGGGGEVEDYAVIIEPPDTAPPEVVEVIGSVEPNEIVVVFSERIDPATASDTFHYSVFPPGVSILGATVLPGRTERVCLTTSGLLAGAGYTLSITGVRDPAGNVLSPDPTAVSFHCEPVVVPGGIEGTKYEDRNGDGRRDGDEPGLPGWQVYLDLDENGAIDQQMTTRSAEALMDVPDLGFITSALEVSGLYGLTLDVDVTLNITHTRDSDLDVYLYSPWGTWVELFTDVGGTGDNFASTTLDDEAELSIASGAAPFAGTYRPEGRLSAFDGQDPNGTWTLVVADDGAGEVGRLNSWSIRIAHGDPVAVTDENGQYAFTGLPFGTYVVREEDRPGWVQTAPGPISTDAEVVPLPGSRYVSWPARVVSLSGDGRFLAFHTDVPLVEADGGDGADVYLYDRRLGTLEWVSTGWDGLESDGGSFAPAISADGRFVAFSSDASNLVEEGDTNETSDVFVWDRQTKQIERIPVGWNGAESNGPSYEPSISADGRFVAFVSRATNLVADDSKGFGDVFLWDRQMRTTELITVGWDGSPSNGFSHAPSISADGRFVAFDSYASNLVDGDPSGHGDVFVWDRQNRTMECITAIGWGAETNGHSGLPSISADGRFVAFESEASNLVDSDTNETRDVFLWNRQTKEIERIPVGWDGAESNGWSYAPSISADGRFVAFGSEASNLVESDPNGHYPDVFIYDARDGTMRRVALDPLPSGEEPSAFNPAVSADGQWVAALTSSQLGFPPTVAATGGTPAGAHTVFVAPGQVVEEIDFGNYCMDFGDSPDSYGTRLEDNGPRHAVGGPYFGQWGYPTPTGLPDADADGQPDPWAWGDDTDAQGDDEEGWWVDGAVVASAEFLLRPAVRGGGGFVSAWVDFDGSGHFDPDELVYSDWLDEGDHEIPIRTPTDAPVGKTFVRCRISTTEGLGPLGYAPDGEVEDFTVWVFHGDWGDAPPPYPTGGADDGAHAMGPDGDLWLGQLVDNEPDARVHPDALGDDQDGTPDEDGVAFLSPLVPGSTATVRIIASADRDSHGGLMARVNGWVDFDGSGDWDSTEKVVTQDIYIDAATSWTVEVEATFEVPATATLGRTFARFRIGRYDMGPTGYGGHGEVEDYAVVIEPPSDTTPPEVVSVTGYITPNQINVVFSEPVDPATAMDPFQYQVSPPGVTVLNVTVIPGSSETVYLTTSGLVSGGSYTLTVTGVRDLAGNPLSPDPTVVGFQCPVVQTSTPGTPDLLELWDTGRSDSDDLTCLDNSDPLRVLRFRVSGTLPGALVQLHADGAVIGWAVAQGRETVVETDGGTALSHGPHAITARQQLPGEDESPDSPALVVTVDTQAPQPTGPLDRNDGAGRFDLLLSLSALFSEDVTATCDALTLRDVTHGVDLDVSVAPFGCAGRVAQWDTSVLRLGPAYLTATLLCQAVSDLAGNALDGDCDGLPGGDYQELVLVTVSGDADLDGDVDRHDLLAMKGFYGQLGCGWLKGDFDGDFAVGLYDYLIVKENYGRQVSLAPPVSAAPCAAPAAPATAHEPQTQGEDPAAEGAAAAAGAEALPAPPAPAPGLQASPAAPDDKSPSDDPAAEAELLLAGDAHPTDAALIAESLPSQVEQACAGPSAAAAWPAWDALGAWPTGVPRPQEARPAALPPQPARAVRRPCLASVGLARMGPPPPTLAADEGLAADEPPTARAAAWDALAPGSGADGAGPLGQARLLLLDALRAPRRRAWPAWGPLQAPRR